jgi:hypothetical protein
MGSDQVGLPLLHRLTFYIPPRCDHLRRVIAAWHGMIYSGDAVPFPQVEMTQSGDV